MDMELIQQEVSRVWDTSYARKTDKQLISYQELSERYKAEGRGVQPGALVRYNQPVNRKCKLTVEQVKTIRSKFVPHVYGKDKLAKEFGVSKSVILRILRGKSWKI